MQKIESLKLNKDFKHCYHRGKSFVSKDLVTYVAKRNNKVFPTNKTSSIVNRNPPAGGEQSSIRIGITASKKIGGAVVRNRARRGIAAAVRMVLAETQARVLSDVRPQTSDIRTVDIVLVARGATAGSKSQYVAKSLKRHFTEAGLINAQCTMHNAQ